MEEMTIGRGTPADLDELFALYQSLKGEPYGTWNDEYPTRDLIREDLEQSIVLLMREGERIVSAIVILEDDEFDMFPGWYQDAVRFCELARLGVAKDRQGLGIARRMLLEAEAAAKAEGFDAVRFLVGAGNLPAQRSYARLGYDVLPDPVDAWGETWLRYQKKL